MSDFDPRYSIDLTDLFGEPVEGDESLRLAIGQRAIELIRERTAEGLDRDGKKFVPSKYSESYSQTMEFKAAGKARGQVNMELTGDMLGLIDILENKPHKITLGWDDEKEAAKAHGHINGSDTLPKRDFFGLTKSQKEQLRNEFRGKVNQSTARRSDGESQETDRDSQILELIRFIQRKL